MTGSTEVAVWIAYLEEGPKEKTSDSGDSSGSNTMDEGPTKTQQQYLSGSSRRASPETAPTESSTPVDTIQKAHHAGQPLNISAGTNHQIQFPTTRTRISELQSELTRQSSIRAKGHELAAQALRISLTAEEHLAAGRGMVAEGRLLVERGRRALQRAIRTRKRGVSYICIADREECRARRELTRLGFGTVSQWPPTPISGWSSHHDTTRSSGMTEGREDGEDWDITADLPGCRSAGVITPRWTAEAAVIPDEVMTAWRKKLRQIKE